MITQQQNFTRTFQMKYLLYPLKFINNILSNNVSVYQSLGKLGTIDISSRTGVISLVYKQDDKEMGQ